ncbi:NUDIX domain-containing protein [Streptomyces sp. CG1]|uniref:NUDIX domain-containing protein n=1 Tax=Streptomyces sp. CG1 TaxID=1287523 RepID=UPI0034E27197
MRGPGRSFVHDRARRCQGRCAGVLRRLGRSATACTARLRRYTPSGGNVEEDESLLAALARELEEELGLRTGRHTPPEFLRITDQRVTRPGPTPSRKLHLSCTTNCRTAAPRPATSAGSTVARPPNC